MKEKKEKVKECKHKWVYSETVYFEKENSLGDFYRIIHHCEHCPQLNIDTIHR
jgi:hypothetical protein